MIGTDTGGSILGDIAMVDDIVELLYRGVLNRDPDPAGMAAYREMLRANLSDATIIQALRVMVTSAEALFVNRHLSAEQSVELIPSPRKGTPVRDIISIGSQCYTSWILKSMNLKKWSGPFDWLFSRPGMILHCLKDDFTTFLDQQYYRTVEMERRIAPDAKRCDHEYYHEAYGQAFIFNHHDPNEPEDYSYFQRGVARFRAALAQEGRTVFLLITRLELMDEPMFIALADAFEGYGRDAELLAIRIKEPEPGRDTLIGVRERCVVGKHRLLDYSSVSNLLELAFEQPIDDFLIKSIVAGL